MRVHCCIRHSLPLTWLQVLVAQTVKSLPAMRKTWVRVLDWEDPLEEGMATHSNILAWSIPMDRGAWWATLHGVTKRQDWVTKHTGFFLHSAALHFSNLLTSNIGSASWSWVYTYSLLLHDNFFGGKMTVFEVLVQPFLGEGLKLSYSKKTAWCSGKTWLSHTTWVWNFEFLFNCIDWKYYSLCVPFSSAVKQGW